jgi:THO complex subunit 3
MISFYDFKKFQCIKQIDFKNKISEFEFDKTNSIVLVSSSTGSLVIIDAFSLESEPLAILDAHYPPISTIAIDKTNSIFATGAADSLICLWDMKELISYKVIKRGETPLRKIVFSHDSKLIASIYEGNNLDIFEVETGDLVHSIPTENLNYSIAWNPANYVLAYCGDDKNRNNTDEGNIHLLSI